jgi:hypothetical protein
MTDDLPPPPPGVAVVGGRPPTPRPEPPTSTVSEPSAGEPGAGEPGAGQERGSDETRSAATATKSRPGTELGYGVLDTLRRIFGRGGGSSEAARPTTLRPAPARSGGPASRWLVPMLLIVTAISLVLAIGFGIAWSNLQSQQNTRATVKRVAHDFLIALTNFRPKNLDSDLGNLQTYATGNFAKQANQFFGTSIRQALEQVQASSEGQIRYLFVQSLVGNQATVYGWVDQTFTNDKLTSVQTDTLQVSLSLSDTSSGWKISEVSVLNSPSPSAIP